MPSILEIKIWIKSILKKIKYCISCKYKQKFSINFIIISKNRIFNILSVILLPNK